MAEAKKDELVIEVPDKFDDSIMEDQHMVTIGENVITCKTMVKDPLKQIGKMHHCIGCGKNFKVVKAKPEIVKTNTGTEG